ncbi:endonuclease/exonuclease/phosphatase family protein [Spongiibacter taiwanensis]|uniref:endonuclease/exonuclease/phosphatase family protein n=1 Tax=Spongiibacter taiwanensis TaxID=1748242 RepID=UPI002034F961|nr:endonuclease/exonuclease/phosphatase family protein [Spongiibacter taiwanensis]USA43415.1 endonuclease/exonuclease/phosphatase family protein [Spongiibacter taiwanensis]
MRILSYNVHKGFCSANRQFLLADIRESIRAVDADVVFLQEVVGENHRHARAIDNWVHGGQFEFLADSIWPHFAYGKNAVYQHGHHGNAILSKFPIIHSDNVDVSLYRQSQRGLLFSEVESGVHLVCVHMGLLGWERHRQFQLLERAIAERVPAAAPLIIAGDFNDWTGAIHQRFKRHLRLREAFTQLTGKPVRSFPVKRPFFRLDRIYYRGFEAVEARRLSGPPWDRLSDHCGIYAELLPADAGARS